MYNSIILENLKTTEMFIMEVLLGFSEMPDLFRKSLEIFENVKQTL